MKRPKPFIFALPALLFLCGGGWSFAAGAEAPETAAKAPKLICPALKHAPKISGKQDDPAWSQAAGFKLALNNGGAEPAQPTEVKIGSTDEGLFLAAVCHEQRMDQVVARAAGHDQDVWADDSIEIFIDPALSRENYYQLVFNSKGVQMEGRNKDLSWDGPWEAQTARGEKEWTAEVFIPWKSLGGAPQPGARWGFNIYRSRQPQPAEYSAWSPTGQGYHEPEMFGVLIFGREDAGAAEIVLGNEFKAEALPPELRADCSRYQKLLEALILCTHAHEVLLRLQRKQGSEECFSACGLAKEQLEALVKNHAEMLSFGGKELRQVCDLSLESGYLGRLVESVHASGLRLDGKLPVNVFADWLHARAPELPRPGLLGLAHLYQLILEVDRDGDVVPATERLLQGLGLPIHLGQLGPNVTDTTLRSMARLLASQTCPAPFATDRRAWTITGRKIENWGEKNRGLATAALCARDLLKQPEVQALLPALRSLPPRRIAIIGHSFTNNNHFCAPACFNGIVEAVFQIENPQVRFTFYCEGGLAVERAKQAFFNQALKERPDAVLFVVLGGSGSATFAEMIKTMQGAGINVWTTDIMNSFTAQEAAAAGTRHFAVGPLLDKHPRRGEFLSLDGVHCTRSYHMLVAAEFLKFLAREGTFSPKGGPAAP